MNAPESQMSWRRKIAELKQALSCSGIERRDRIRMMGDLEQLLCAQRGMHVLETNTNYQPIGGKPPTHKEWMRECK